MQRLTDEAAFVSSILLIVSRYPPLNCTNAQLITYLNVYVYLLFMINCRTYDKLVLLKPNSQIRDEPISSRRKKFGKINDGMF